MHPDVIWAVAYERTREKLVQADAKRLARAARAAWKARRRGGDACTTAADPLTAVRIPDYVDGTFRAEHELEGNSPRPRGAETARSAWR